MRWEWKPKPWRKRFAVLPFCVEGEWIWWEPYWVQHTGLYTLVTFEDPYAGLALSVGEDA